MKQTDDSDGVKRCRRGHMLYEKNLGSRVWYGRVYTFCRKCAAGRSRKWRDAQKLICSGVTEVALEA